jgi:O-Antigen ligase
MTVSRLMIFLCAAITMIPADAKGQVFVGEIVLPFLTLALLVFSTEARWRRNSVLHHSLLALTLTLAGYILADSVHHTSPQDYLRGWARVIVLGTNAFGLTLLGLEDEAYLWWYSLGLGLGSGATYLVMGTPFAIWKFTYALSVSSIVLCLASFMSRFGAVVILSLYGLVNVILLDSRAFGAVSFIVAMLLFARMRNRRKSHAGLAVSLSRLMVAAVVAASVLFITYETSQAIYRTRRSVSNAIRWANAQAALDSIIDSPIIGHGSWAFNFKMEMAFRFAYFSFTGQSPSVTGEGIDILPHSQILSAWYEGGLFGMAFFIYYGYALVRYGIWYTLRRPYNYMTPLYLFISLQSMWHMIMSPFAGSQRLAIAYTVAVLCRLYYERQESERARFPASREAA